MSIVTSLSTVSHMILAFPALSSRTSATSAQLNHYLEGAAYEVLGKLSKRYNVPVEQPNNDLHKQLNTLTTRLALQMFLTERAYMQERQNESEFPKEFERAREQLDEIAKGAIPLINNDGTVIAGKGSEIETWSSAEDYLPTFTEDSVFASTSEIDPDKIDDIRDERDDN